MTVQVTTFSCSTGTLDVSLTCLTWIRVLGLAVLRFLGSASAASCLQADPVSPDARGRGRGYSADEPDEPASEGSRKPEFDGGKRGSRRIGDESDNQSDDPASDARKAEARRLYHLAGYSPSHPLHFELRYNQGEVHTRLAVVITEMWKRVLGVDAQPTAVEFRVLINEIENHEVEVFRSSWIGDYNDPLSFLQVFQTDPDIVGV